MRGFSFFSGVAHSWMNPNMWEDVSANKLMKLIDTQLICWH